MFSTIFLPLVRLALFTALVRGGFLWLEQSHQIYVDRWIVAMIGAAESVAVQVPTWVGWTLTGTIGLLAMTIWEVAKYRGWFPWQSIARPGVTTGQSSQTATEGSDPYIPLKEAATIAYEETRGTKAAIIAEGPNPDDILGYYAYALFKGSTMLYGKHPPSRKLERVPKEEYGRCGFSDDYNSLRRHGKDRNLYEDLQIRRSDLSRRITELKDLGAALSREERARKIGKIYAEAVELRNRAALLQVLDAATESKMDDLQGKLTEEIRELAPEQTINLDTLNLYDWRNHPLMNLTDPKRTLEFSECLRRVMKILEDYK